MHWERRLAVTGVLTLMAFAATGCSRTPTVCPAVGWANQIVVHVTGDATHVATVKYCGRQACRSVLPEAIAPTRTAWPIPPVRDGDTWRIDTDMTTPRAGHVAALDDTGAVLADSKVALRWEAMREASQCPGPTTATVELHVG